MTTNDMTAIATAVGVLDDQDTDDTLRTTVSDVFWASVTFCSAIAALIVAGIGQQGVPL